MSERKHTPKILCIFYITAMCKLELSDGCHIYKVPCHLRKLNEEAYTPHVISVGPIHRNKKIFQTMESHKENYFESSIKEMKDSMEMTLDKLVEIRKQYKGDGR